MHCIRSCGVTRARTRRHTRTTTWTNIIAVAIVKWPTWFVHYATHGISVMHIPCGEHHVCLYIYIYIWTCDIAPTLTLYIIHDIFMYTLSWITLCAMWVQLRNLIMFMVDWFISYNLIETLVAVAHPHTWCPDASRWVPSHVHEHDWEHIVYINIFVADCAA